MRCHTLRIARRRAAIRRRQSETAAREDQEGPLHHTIICAARLPRALAQNDRDRPQQATDGKSFAQH